MLCLSSVVCRRRMNEGKLISCQCKQVECGDCYHMFWVTREIPLKMVWCTHCNSLNVRLARDEHGAPVYQERQFRIFDNNEET